MCRFKSGIAVKAGDDVRLFTLPDEDSHTEIRDKFNIDDGDGASASRQTPVEFAPTADLLDFDSYEFRFGADKPDWWTDSMTGSVIRQFKAALHEQFAHGVKLEYSGDICLDGLLRLPANVNLSAGEGLLLNSLIRVPDNVNLSAGDYIDLRHLTRIGKNVRIMGGRAILWNNQWLANSRELRENIKRRQAEKSK